MTLTLAARLTFDGQKARQDIRAAAGETKGLAQATREAGQEAGRAGGQMSRYDASLAAVETELRGVTSAQVAQAQAARTAASVNTAAAGSVGNLAANFNDLTVMLAAGQNPLQLALQQGTQISQVFAGQGAAGAVNLLKQGLLSIISPVNLITIGVIALGAAAVQWFMGAAEAGQTLEDQIGDLEDAVRRYRSASDDAGLSIAEMTDKFGAANPALRQALADLAAMERLRVDEKLREIAAAMREAALANDANNNAGGNFLGVGPGFETSQLAERIGRAQAAAFRESLDQLNAATTAAERYREALNLREQFLGITGGLQSMNAEQRTFFESLNRIIIQSELLGVSIQSNADSSRAFYAESRLQSAAALADAQAMLASLQGEAAIRQLIQRFGADSAVVAEARVAAERKVQAAMVASLDVSQAMKDQLMAAWDAANKVATVDMSGRIASAAGAAAPLARRLWDAVGAQTTLNGLGRMATDRLGDDERGSQREGLQSLARFRASQSLAAANRRSAAYLAPDTGDSGGGGGGGGGASAADAEADAIARLVAAQERELELLRETDPLKQELIRQRETLAGASEAERAQIEALIETRMREASQLEANKRLTDFLNQSTMNWLTMLTDRGTKASDVLRSMLSTLLQAAQQAFVMGQGPLAGILGISGGLFDAAGVGGGGIKTLSKGVVRAGGLQVLKAGATGPVFAKGAAAEGRPAGGGGTSVLRVEIGEGLRARVLQEAGHQTVQIVQQALERYDAAVLPQSIGRVSRDGRRVG